MTLHLTVIMDVLVSVCRLRLAMDLIDTISQSGHGCASSRLDLIYTDIVGYRELPESLTQAYR